MNRLPSAPATPASARAWLESRAADVPGSLHERMLAAVDTTAGADTLAGLLADAALSCLRDAAACGEDRSAALHLLAADALMTDACEAAAAAGEVQAFAGAFSVDRLSAAVGHGAAPGDGAGEDA